MVDIASREPQGHPGPGMGHGNLLAMELNGSDPGFQIAGEDLHPLPLRYATRPECSGDDGPGSPDGEYPVQGKAGQVLDFLLPGFRAQGLQGRQERIGPFSCDGGKGDDRGLLVGGLPEGVPDILRRQLQPFLLHQVRLGEGHQHLGNAQKTHDGQMLPGLGHDPFVGGYHQENHVHAGGAGHHVPYESLMARHVHHPEVGSIRCGKLGEAQIHRDAPGLLLFQSVRVHPGEALHQGCLPVIDMACRAQNQSTHGPWGSEWPEP